MPHNLKSRRAIRDQRICELAAQDHTAGYISECIANEGLLRASKATVQRVVSSWLIALAEDTARPIEQLRAQRLQNHARIVREAWAAWERSKSARESTKTKRAMKPPAGLTPDQVAASLTGVEHTKTVETQVGDPRFLIVIQNSEAQVARLLGLDQPRAPEDEVSRMEDALRIIETKLGLAAGALYKKQSASEAPAATPAVKIRGLLGPASGNGSNGGAG